MREIDKELGFESEAEMWSMVSKVDLTDPFTMQRFNEWKQKDGTKEGLVKIIEGDLTN